MVVRRVARLLVCLAISGQYIAIGDISPSLNRLYAAALRCMCEEWKITFHFEARREMDTVNQTSRPPKGGWR